MAAPNDDPDVVLTAKQRCNLEAYMKLLGAVLVDKKYVGQHATIFVERQPSRVFGPLFRCDDLCGCLVTGRKPIWVTSLGEGRRPRVHRLLRPEELWALQGFDAQEMPQLAPHVVSRATGNAMSVPVVGLFWSRLCAAC